MTMDQILIHDRQIKGLGLEGPVVALALVLPT